MEADTQPTPPNAGRQLVWVTGAAGLIGSWVARTPPKGYAVEALTRSKLELTDFAAVEQLFRSQNPAAVVHCAGLTKSLECETDRARAHEQNVEVTKHLTGLAEEIPFVFFSTDLVFDGRSGNYDEAAAVNPLTVYGETKVAAEQVVLRNPRHTVIRTSLNAGPSPSGDRAFDEEIRRAWQAGRQLRFFTDEFRCPIPAEVTALATWELLLKGFTGLVHLAGAERLSRWNIGSLLARGWRDLEPRYEAASIKDWNGPPRAADTSLNCKKAQLMLSFQLPRGSDWLSKSAQD